MMLFPALALLAGCGEEPSACTAGEVAGAKRMVLVTTRGWDEPTAEFSTFERDTPQSTWRQTSAPEPAVVGSKGVAWGWPYREAARRGEPLKVEGDLRTPVGIFKFGPTFGFEAAANPGHIKLEPLRHVCVDDPSSPHYNRIVSREEAGPGTRGEEMSSVVVYEKGLVVDYPSNARAKAGSCIFLHIWTGPGAGTSGCIATQRELVERLQSFATSPPAVIAIVPEQARARFAPCLP